MSSKTQWNGGIKGMGWFVGSVSLLLLISAGGLEFFARHVLGQANVATLLLALFLAFWSYVLGIAGLLFLSVWWLVGWLRVGVQPVAMNRYASAELRSRRLEEPEPKNPQFLHQSVAPVVSSRLTMESDDRNKATSPSRVA